MLLALIRMEYNNSLMSLASFKEIKVSLNLALNYLNKISTALVVKDVAICDAIVDNRHVQRVAEELGREHGFQLARTDTVGAVDVEFGFVAAVCRRLRRI